MGGAAAGMGRRWKRRGEEGAGCVWSDAVARRAEGRRAAVLRGGLRNEGMDINLGVKLECAKGGGSKSLRGRAGADEKVWQAEEIFVAAGRAPNIESLDLESAGVKTTPKGIGVDKHLRTSVPSVYAVGDCAGRYLFTHSAGAEAVVALRHMFYLGAHDAPTAGNGLWMHIRRIDGTAVRP